MATVQYLAMTASEFAANKVLPSNIGWMACHFSPYEYGLTDLPHTLPPDSLLILNDRIPIREHDPQKILRQLQETAVRCGCRGVLLDFQKMGCRELKVLASYLVSALPCPVAVSENYACDLSCPVFLSPCPHHIPLKEHAKPWLDREIWLDLAADAEALLLTKEGMQVHPLPCQDLPSSAHWDQNLHCHYSIALTEESARFTLWRTQADVDSLAEEAERLGVTTFVGLYRELGL